MPFRLARNVRTLHRIRMIAQVLTKHGFGHLVEMMDLGRFVPLWRRSHPKPDTADEASNVGQRLVSVATELGPTYVKLGQMLSTRPDLLPPEVLASLQQLQDNVAPFASSEARAIVERDLGLPVDEAFAVFENQAFASGSIAQVHRAETRQGRPVVVKVRRPGIDAIIRDDMHILGALAEALETYVPELKPYRPTQIIEEFSRNITWELDFVHEASATARFREDFLDDKRIRVPIIYWDLTGPEVLTQEYLTGESLHTILATRSTGIDRHTLAENLAAIFLRQYFETGLFHADPHPGNMLITPPAIVGLIDFGMIGQVSEETMTQLMVALVGAVNRQVDWVVDVLAELGSVGTSADLDQLRRDMKILLDKYHGLPLRRLDLPTIFHEITDLVRRHDIVLPSDFVLLAKSLTMTAGTVLRLDPEFDLVALLQPRLKKLIMRRFSPGQLGRTMAFSMWHVGNILKNAPAQLRQAIRHMTRGQWQINIQHQNLDRLSRELDRSSNRLSIALIIAATVIGSSMMLASDSTRTVLGIDLNTLGVAGYLFSGALGMGLVWAIFRSGRLY